MQYRDSLACDLDQVFPYLSPALVGTAHRARLRAFAAQVPSMDGGFESPLTGDGPPADVSLRCAPDEAVARVITGAHPQVQLPSALASRPVWRRAARVLPDVPPDGHLWFEYDDADLACSDPTPNLIVVTGENGGHGALADPLEGIAALGGADVDAASLGLAKQAIALLPEQAKLIEIGVMEARPGRPLRLRIGGLAPAALDALATALGWFGRPWQRRVLHGLSALYPTLAVVMDIAEGRVRRFGVTMPCHEYPSAASHTPRTTACLSWLLMQGLCAPAAAVGVRDWFGWSEDARDPARFPYGIALREASDLVGALVRVFVQFKLVFDPDGAVCAKAYYGFLRLRSRRELAGAPPIGAPLAIAA